MPKSHGMSNTPIYRLWWGMLSRCEHPKTRGYANYGGRGVKVCERWRKFENFYFDMGDRPAGMTLERRAANGNYDPSNVYWATNYAQQRNRTNNVRLTWGSREWVLKDLCRSLGVYSTHVYRVMARGKTLSEAVQHLVNLKERRNAKVIASQTGLSS